MKHPCLNAFDAALEKAKRDGHKLVYDPPHELATVLRYTCKKCGQAVLGNASVVYGSATENPCKKS